jgi:hypothetical protein
MRSVNRAGVGDSFSGGELFVLDECLVVSEAKDPHPLAHRAPDCAELTALCRGCTAPESSPEALFMQTGVMCGCA